MTHLRYRFGRQGRVQAQPGFCAICGAEVSTLAQVQNHLWDSHRLNPRARTEAFKIAWREAWCALLGILHPEWSGP